MKRIFNTKCSKAFTLIELLVVIAVIGVIAIGIIVGINPAKRINQAKDAQIKNDIGQIARTFTAYSTTSTNQSWPSAVADISGAGKDFKTEPKRPGGASYTVVVNPAGATPCTTAANNCTDVAVYGTMFDSTNVVCWRSSTNTITEVATASCTAP